MEADVFQGLDIQTTTRKGKQASKDLTAPALMLKLIWEAECQGRFLAGEQVARR